jgi:hypothetical protein
MLRAAEYDPAAVGEKVICTVQKPPGAIGAKPQLLVWVNVAGLAPVLPMKLTVRGAPPELVTVKERALVVPARVDGKLKDVVESVAPAPAVAMPVNVTVCGSPGALSPMLSVAENEPTQPFPLSAGPRTSGLFNRQRMGTHARGS